MPLSHLLLLLWVFLMSASFLGWFATSAFILGVLGVTYVVVSVLELLGVLTYSLPTHARR